MLLEGSIFADRYEIVRLIGKGGMGAVYEAKHRETDARVALKIIESKELDENTAERFRREARAAASIESQHTVKVFDAGVDFVTKLPFIAMERLRGQDLASILLKRKLGLAPDIALKIASQAAIGLMRAHELGIVHRDIKPANLFLTESDGEVCVKILDFGIAKLREEPLQGESSGLTQEGNLLGSPQYMSPEQAQGLRSVDQRTDIWSLGIVIYEMLTGQSPYLGRTTIGQLVLAICSAPPPPIEDLLEGVTPELSNLLRRANALDPNDRYVSANEMYAALRRLVPRRSIALEQIISPEDIEKGSSQRARATFPGDFDLERTASDTTQPLSRKTTTSDRTLEASTRSVGSDSNERPWSAETRQAVRKPQKKKRSPKWLIGVGAGTIAILAIIALSVTQSRGRLKGAANGGPATSVTPSPSGSSPSSTASASTTTPSNTPSTSEPSASTKMEANERLGVLLFDPPQATIAINGKEMTADPGRLILRGTLGETYRVTLKFGGQEATHLVVMSQQGPIPDRVQLVKRSPTPATSSSSSHAIPIGEEIRSNR